MSQMTAARPARVRGASAPTSTPRRTPLRLVEAVPRSSSSVGFALLLMAIIVGGLVATLLLNTSRAEGSFVLSDLRAEVTELHDQRVTLEAELSEKQAPGALAEQAQDLGMVRSPSTAVLRLSDGAVLGVAATAEDGDTHTVDTSSVVPGERGDSASGEAASSSDSAAESSSEGAVEED